MTGQTNESQWYIARDGKQHGPLTDVEMRTFMSHSYLRPSDLLWRPGMADWQPAPAVFPAAFQAATGRVPAAVRPRRPLRLAAAPATGRTTAGVTNAAAADRSAAQNMGTRAARRKPRAPEAASAEFGAENFEEESPRSGRVRQAAIAIAMVALIGGAAYAIVNYREPLMRIVSGPPKKPATAAAAKPAPAPAQTAGAPAPAVEAAAVPARRDDARSDVPDPALIEGSAIDQRLQKIPFWGMLKKDYPDWYITNVAAAEKLSAEKKPELEVTTQLVQGLVSLRRQNAEKALSASPEKLKNVANAFLENLRALQAQSVGACYGFISKGEMSPVIVDLMQKPENAASLNAHLRPCSKRPLRGRNHPSSTTPRSRPITTS